MARSQTSDVQCSDDFGNNPNKNRITLLKLHVGEKGKITRIIGGQSACKRLNELGLVPGVQVELVNRISSGPVMIRVKGSKLALGRGLAQKVEIEKI